MAPWVSGLVVMDYRTDASEIYRFAVPFLDWGERHGKTVRIALEAGPIAPETRYRYEQAPEGELWQVQLEERHFLLMLRSARPNPHGSAFRLANSSITRTGVIAGTPLYMSPEQARGEAIDARSDLFSLGSVLYTLATGRAPFRAESTYGILRRLTDEAPRPVREITPQLPAWFAMIVHKLLAKQPSERFGSASEVAQLLEGCLAHVQQPTMVELPEACRVAVPRRLRMAISSLLVIAVVGLIIAMGMVFIPGQKPRPLAPGTQTTLHPGPSHPSTNSASGNRQPDESPDPLTDPNTEWDAVDQDLAPLRRDLDQWTRDAKQLWPP